MKKDDRMCISFFSEKIKKILGNPFPAPAQTITGLLTSFRESMEANKLGPLDLLQFVPDYYLLAPHGTGRNSIHYYLSRLGSPVSFSTSMYRRGRVRFLRFPVPKGRVQGRGILCERFFQGSPLTYGKGDQKVIQMLRDPVDVATHIVNMHIAALVSCHTGWVSDLLSLLPTINGSIMDQFAMSFMFSSMRRCVRADLRQTLYIDNTDLRGEECLKTMRRVAVFLGVPYDSSLDAVFNFAYNSPENRIWLFQPAKMVILPSDAFLNGQLGSHFGGIRVFPSVLHDFAANHLERAHVLSMVSYNGADYVVSMPERFFLRLPQAIREKLWDDKKNDAIKRYLSLWFVQKEAFDRLYDRYRKSPDDVIGSIRLDPVFHTKFMRAMEHEISLPAKEAPELVERWKNFHRL